MDKTAADPANAEEALIAWTIQLTWVFYAIGALYIVGPVLGWTLATRAAWRLYVGPALPPERRPNPVPPAVMLWLGGMFGMLAVLLAGHLLNDLGAAQTIKSATGWAKGWALLGLFPLAGAVLNVRIAVISRAVCRLGLQTILLMPLFFIAHSVGLPGLLYVSPLSVFGGSGPEFFAVTVYIVDPENGALRWQYYAPWAPAAGMVAVVHMICALQERHMGWKLTGLAANLMIAWFSQSRMAILATGIIWPVALFVSRLNRPWTWFASAPLALIGGLLANTIAAMIDQAVDDFKGARADSSRVRAALGRIAVERWQHEAPWFGHGVVERGPHLVEYMPIGSHHSWYGLLFVKGLAGVICLAVPIAGATALLGWLSTRSDAARVGFAMLLVLLFYSFGENLEVLGYLIWPGLTIIGTGSRAGPAPPPMVAGGPAAVVPG